MDGSGGRDEEDVHMDAGDGGGTDSAAGGAAAMMYSPTDYTQYNVYGHLIEVPSKYCPPIQPIGRGAYGIVCTGFPGFSECGCISAYICNLRLLKIRPLFLRLALVQNSGIIFSAHIAAQRLALRTDTLDAVVGGSLF
jgi:hypothetical protein